MHTAFEFADVDGGREVRVSTAVFSAFERLSQQQEKVDEHDVLQSVTWSIAYRRERGANGVRYASSRRASGGGASKFDGWASCYDWTMDIAESVPHFSKLCLARVERLCEEANPAKRRSAANTLWSESRVGLNT
jgi:hypothetical protein